MTGRAVFLDTTIQIARIVHGPKAKELIRQKIASFDCSVTSLVVWEEFKRRLLKDAQYLLNLLNEYGSFERTQRHVLNVLPAQLGRKQKICLLTLQSIFEDRDDAELTERAKRTLRNLIRLGPRKFQRCVDAVLSDSGCACAKQAVIEITPYKRYEFGVNKCSALGSSCGIAESLAGKHKELLNIQTAIQATSDVNKTKELRDADAFISRLLSGALDVTLTDPCHKVGDLLIALESRSIPCFYTMNIKESTVLCPALGQELVILDTRLA
jgi:hypothetical protein